jgi:hypothetical protein
MKLAHLQESLDAAGRAPRKAPEYLIYMPPSGAPVECPPGFDIVQAGAAASRIAARHPGQTVAVYVLAGTAIAPLTEPDFVPAATEPSAAAADAGRGCLEPPPPEAA